MTDQAPANEPVPTLAQSVARTVKRLREKQRLPYTELSERLTQLGHPIPVLGLRRIERGQRRVDVDEIGALAKALGVPPLLLLFPLGVEPEVECLAGLTVDTWTGAQWFMGEARFPDDNPSTYGTLPLILFRRHQKQLAEYDTRAAERDLFPAPADDPGKQRAAMLAEKALLELRGTRADIRAHGLTPPELPSYLQDVDSKRHVFLTPEQVAALPPGSVKPVNYRDYLDFSHPVESDK